MKKISVVTVCLNEVKLIEKTLTSVINQTFKDFEYIVIDGGSTDGTLDIIEKYKDKIDKFVSEKDDGIYDAMNKGIKLAEGEYLIFINGGDYLVNEKVFERVFESKPTEDIIYGDGLLLFSNGFIMGKKFPKKISKFFMFYDTLPHQDTLSKKYLFKKTNGFDTELKIAADYNFFLNAIFKIKATYHYIPIAMVVNNLEGISNQKQYKLKKQNERYISFSKYFSTSTIKKLKLIKPFYLLLIKYPKYLLNFVSSYFSKGYN